MLGKNLLSHQFLIDGILPNLSNNTSQDYAILNYLVFPKNFEKNLKIHNASTDLFISTHLGKCYCKIIKLSWLHLTKLNEQFCQFTL